jgi:hypothetical protein
LFSSVILTLRSKTAIGLFTSWKKIRWTPEVTLEGSAYLTEKLDLSKGSKLDVVVDHDDDDNDDNNY